MPAHGSPMPADDLPTAAPTALVAFALDAWRATPALLIEDAYKWLLQATLGPEHAVRDEEAARAWLAREWAALPASPARTEPLERLREDGAYVRAHLRPLKARGMTEAAVLDAFLMSARDVGHRSPSAFVDAWEALGARLTTHAAGPLTRAAWVHLDRETRARDFPPVHHSDAYRAAYAPAYRVLLRRSCAPLVARPGTDEALKT